MEPFVSVIVPALDAERTVAQCLTSLLRLDYPVERREILVVDNGSTDRTAEILGGFPIRHVREERRGAATARNRGIEASQGEILAFLDADCVATSGWLRELLAGFDSQAVGVVTGEVVAYPPRTPAERYVARRRPFIQRHALSHPAFPWFSFANVALRREVFRTIGLLDHRFRGAEDIDLSWRVLGSDAFVLRHRPRAVAFHHNHVEARGLFRRYLRYGYGHALLCRTYPGRHLWDWRRELRAHGDLLRAAATLGLAAARSTLTGAGATDLSWRRFELVRKLGQRIGFVQGSLRPGGGAS